MKQGVGLLVSLAVTVCMGGFLIYTLTQQNTQPHQEQTPENQSRILLRDTQIQAVNTVTISNSSGSYTLVNLGNGLALKEREAVPYQKKKLEQIAQAASHVAAKQLITHRTAKDCGLELPLVTVTVDYIDKPALTLLIGKEEENGICIMADSKIYLADAKEMSPFLMSEKELVSTSLTPNKTEDSPILSITLSGEVRPQPIQLEMVPKKGEDDPLRYTITAPRQEEINGEDVLSWATPTLGITADRVAHLNPDSRDMTAYGFDKPFSILDMTVGDESFSLIASSIQDGMCYIMRQGAPVVYQVEAGKLPWLTLQVEGLAKTVFNPSPVEKVRQVVVATPNQSWTYKLTQEETGFFVTVNEKPLSANQFKALYQQLSTSVQPEEYVGALDVDGNPLLTVQISYTDENLRPDNLSLLPGPEEGSVYLRYNGKTRYTGKKSLIEEITSACRETVKSDQAE